MNEADFVRAADVTLARVFETVDSALGDVLDVDMDSGVLQIETPDGATFILNKHTSSLEIWLSSPVSGAWHFRASPDGRWRATRGGAQAPELAKLLGTELSQIAGRPISIDC